MSTENQAFGRVPGLVAARVHDFPGYADIRNPGRRAEVLDRFVWLDAQVEGEPASRNMDSHIVDIFPPAEGAPPMGFEFRRLGRLHKEDSSTSAPAPAGPLAYEGHLISIEGTHFAFPLVITELGAPIDAVQEELIVAGPTREAGAFQGPAAFRQQLRAVGSFQVPMPADPYSGTDRLRHAFPERTTLIYAVTGADGSWRTATNVAITYQENDPRHELVIYRGARA